MSNSEVKALELKVIDLELKLEASERLNKDLERELKFIKDNSKSKQQIRSEHLKNVCSPE